MEKSFKGSLSPFVMEMVQARTPSVAQSKIENAIADGATAIGLQLHFLPRETRTPEVLRKIFETAQDKPVYVTNYRGGANVGMSDEDLTDELLVALRSGATLVDVMGDCFHKSEDELATDEKAIEKQMRYIDEVHWLGGEVLMSSHVHKFCHADRVLEMALEHQRRGADVVKIVTGGHTQEEELKNLEICALLKKELKVPFLFLSTGTHVQLHRLVGPALGVCAWLGFREYDETTYAGPPLLKDILQVKQGLKL